MSPDNARQWFNNNPFTFMVLFIAFVIVAQLWFNTIYEFIQHFYPDENPPISHLFIISLIVTIILIGFVVYLMNLPITSITVG